MTIITGMEGPTKRNNNVVDFHAHVLPGADHGSTGLSCSKIQINQAFAAGVKTIVATPHFYPQKQNLDNFLYIRDRAYNEILPYAKEKGVDIVCGAEIFACAGIQKMSGLDKLCIGAKKVLLIEMPTEGKWSYNICESVFALQEEMGYTVLLAHIDRYDDNDIDYMLKGGLLAQINADSVCSRLKRKRLLKLIDEGHVVALGSDLHKDDQGYKEFIKAVKIINKHSSDFMTRANMLL